MAQAPNDVRPVPARDEPLQSQKELVGGVGRIVYLLRSDDFGAR